MGKRLTVLATALLLVWSMTAAAFAKEPEISVEIDQTGQDSAVAVVTLGSAVYTSVLVKVPGEPWYDFTWALEDAKSMTLPVYENGTVQVQATRENGTKATASATVDCLPEPEPLDCPVEPEPEKEPEPLDKGSSPNVYLHRRPGSRTSGFQHRISFCRKPFQQSKYLQIQEFRRVIDGNRHLIDKSIDICAYESFASCRCAPGHCRGQRLRVPLGLAGAHLLARAELSRRTVAATRVP